MAKKKKRKLQPHEKLFGQTLVLGLCIALFFAVLGWPRKLTFEEADITVRSCDTILHGRHRRALQIISAEGQRFNVFHAERPFAQLREVLVPGTEVHVEYCHDWFIRLIPDDRWPVTKLTLNGQVLADNPPGDHTGILRLMWLGLPFPLLGFLCWADGEHLLKKWKKKREKKRKQRNRNE